MGKISSLNHFEWIKKKKKMGQRVWCCLSSEVGYLSVVLVSIMLLNAEEYKEVSTFEC